MSIKVRQLNELDEARWRELWIGYVAFYERITDDDQIETLWRRLISEDMPVHGFVACNSDNKVIGIAHFLYHATTLGPQDKCYLQDLYVDPDCRTSGAGRALIEAVYAEAKAHDASEVYWMTQQFNSVARVLYDRVGERTPFMKYRKAL